MFILIEYLNSERLNTYPGQKVYFQILISYEIFKKEVKRIVKALQTPFAEFKNNILTEFLITGKWKNLLTSLFQFFIILYDLF